MYTRTARFYDAVYAWKNYRAEVARLREIIRDAKRSPGNTLLDVACGTGQHLSLLRDDYQVEGLDLDENMLAVARAKTPGVTFHRLDMVDFSLARQFDVVTCLFSSIGYVKTAAMMERAIANMAQHVVAGGVLIVEPWFSLEELRDVSVPHALFVEQPDLKIARINTATVENSVYIGSFHYLIGDRSGIFHEQETHELGLFTRDEYLDAFRRAGLEVTYDKEGLMKRGLYIGVKPAP